MVDKKIQTTTRTRMRYTHTRSFFFLFEKKRDRERERENMLDDVGYMGGFGYYKLPTKSVMIILYWP